MKIALTKHGMFYNAPVSEWNALPLVCVDFVFATFHTSAEHLMLTVETEPFDGAHCFELLVLPGTSTRLNNSVYTVDGQLYENYLCLELRKIFKPGVRYYFTVTECN